jgi:predicted AAA+ superfamily ATPase
MRIPAQYLDTLLSSSPEILRRSEHTAKRLLLSLARNLGSAVTHKTIVRDILLTEEGESAAASAIARVDPYLDVMKNQFIIEDVPGWDAPVRSRSRVRTKPKRSFVDPSLAASLLGVSAERLLWQSQLLGVLFEELCLRDLRIYASALADAPSDPVMYYRDSDGLEVDAVVELRDGRWAAFEVKLSEDKVAEAERSLLRLKNKILANPLAKNNPPSFLAVIVGKATFCRKTPNGIYVLPITCLGA